MSQSKFERFEEGVGRFVAYLEKKFGRFAPLEQYSNSELLGELASRGSWWNSCAIGEKFKNKSVSWEGTSEKMSSQGMDEVDRVQLFHYGLLYMEHLDEAQKCYDHIKGYEPKLLLKPTRKEIEVES